MPSHACLNDRDTLAEEVRGLPDVVQVITGRFERNPPLYYEMRLARVAKELQADPTLLNDYDDAAVACDRLGRDDEALAWMAKKRVQLAQVPRNTPDGKEAWYRYYANDGTARVHRWIRAGADRKRIAEVVQARDEIAQALKLKPDAHFGREKYQLQVMNWLILSRTHPSAKKEKTLAEYFNEHTDDPTGAAKGLSGLIVLGNAWESPDVFEALASQFAEQEKPKLALLADLRARELRHESLRPLSDGNWDEHDMAAIGGYLPALVDGSGPQLEKIYPRLRAEAEQWQRQRSAYMVARLQAGRHPDTDPTFWNEYHDSGPPVISPDELLSSYELRRRAVVRTTNIAFTGICGAMCLCLLLLARRGLLRCRAAARTASDGAGGPQSEEPAVMGKR